MRLAFFVLAAASMAPAQIVFSSTQNGALRQLEPPAAVTPEKDKCVVTGRVTNSQSGEALKKVNVHLMRTGGGQARMTGAEAMQGYAAVSAADGSFRFEGVEPGNYALMGERPGYLQTRYGSKSWLGAGTTLTLKPAQTLSDLKLELLPQSTISGKVLDEDGDPAGNVTVQALGRTANRGKTRYFPMSSATTDDTGAYRLANLHPGKYYVVAETGSHMVMNGAEQPSAPGKPDIRPVRTFYPDALERVNASPVAVSPGQAFAGVDIRMRSLETFHIRGKVTGVYSENENGTLMLALSPRDSGIPFGFRQTFLGKDHTFDIGGVAPGAYMLNLMSMRGQVRQSAHQPVDVGSASVNDVVISVSPAFTIRGALEIEGAAAGGDKEKALENVRVGLNPEQDGDAMFGNSVNALTKPDGTFTLENLVPGKVRAQIFSVPEGAYVKSIQFGQQEVFGKAFDLSPGGGDLRVVLRYGAAEVSGVVQTADAASTSKAASTVSVLLIPDDTSSDDWSPRTGGTNQSGGFTMKGVRPGRYHALALEIEDQLDLQDPAFLKQLIGKATDVEVKENDKRQIQLNPIPAAELQQAMAAAGIEN